MKNEITILISTHSGMVKRKPNPLKRLLNSLKDLNTEEFRVIILDTTDPPDTSVGKIIKGLIENYKKHFKIMRCSILDLWKIHEFLENNGFSDMVNDISLKGYANFRNFGLIVARILRSKLILMLDDDEVVNEKDFLKMVREGIGTTVKGKRLYGKTGYYVYKDGGYKLKPRGIRRKKMWPVIQTINKVLENIVESKKRFNETTIALAGLMVLYEKLYTKIPFDPEIPRGEDTDYLMNAKQWGFRFIMDNQLKILHCPVKYKIDFWEHLRQDIYRFVYVREKLSYFSKLDINDFEPYPGIFLKNDLEYRATVTSINYATRALSRNKKKYFREHMRNIEITFKDAKEHAVNNAHKYFRFQKRWEKMMKVIPKSRELRKFFNRFQYAE